ncbi:hypothetical protein B7463_g5776, partial [Scytalidium lignicola]
MDGQKTGEFESDRNIQVSLDGSQRDHDGIRQVEAIDQMEQMDEIDQVMDSDDNDCDENEDGELQPQQQTQNIGTSIPIESTRQDERKIYKENMRRAFEWMLEHPTESPRDAGRHFGVIPRSVARKWKRYKERQGRPPKPIGRPKVILPKQEAALAKFCRDCYEGGSPVTRHVVWAAAAMLRSLEDPPKPPPAKNWLRTWLRTSPLHAIKTTPPMSRGRKQAVVMENVRRRLANLPEIPKDTLLPPGPKVIPFKDQEYEIIVPRDIVAESATNSQQLQSESPVDPLEESAPSAPSAPSASSASSAPHGNTFAYTELVYQQLPIGSIMRLV